MLPLHGQDTAAVKIFHWAGLTSYKSSRGDVFDKQAGPLFAEFIDNI